MEAFNMNETPITSCFTIRIAISANPSLFQVILTRSYFLLIPPYFEPRRTAVSLSASRFLLRLSKGIGSKLSSASVNVMAFSLNLTKGCEKMRRPDLKNGVLSLILRMVSASLWCCAISTLAVFTTSSKYPRLLSNLFPKSS